MSNTNCLVDMQCPQCASPEPFNIVVKTLMKVFDNGTDDHRDTEWEDDAFCECCECEFSGTVADFRNVSEQEAMSTSAGRHSTSATAGRFTVADADRLLSLGDEFLSNWAEDAVQAGERDLDYEERIREWEAIRPLLAFAPAMRDALETIAAAPEGCTCATRGWYGHGHDTQCPIRIARDVLPTKPQPKE